MEGARQKAWIPIAIGSFAVFLAIFVGVGLRLNDPLSSPVIPAEDPYTHMSLVREHLRDGNLEALYDAGSLYPPGLHAFLAATWSFTGIDLYDIVRFGPVAFGAIGILGMALLLWRHEGPTAAFVGSLAYAVIPEVVFRTTMMSPTALDLALLPFLLYALLEMVRGRLTWLAVAAPVSIYMVIAHPWLFAILGLAGVVFALLGLVLPWPTTRAPPASPQGLAAALAVVGVSLGLSLAMGAGYIAELPPEVPLRAIGWLTMGLAMVPLVLSIVRPRMVERLISRPQERRVSWVTRIVASAAIAVALVAGTLPALQNGLPAQVEPARMIGLPVLVLAGAALVALPFVRGPLPHLGAAWFAATFPFAMYNPLDSPFWPHRTVAFLAVALVILTGVAAAALVRVLRTVGGLLVERSAASGRTRRVARALAVGVPVALVGLTLAGGVYAATPEEYPGWYRLYSDCEMEAFQELAATFNERPDAIIITGSWQAKLVLSSMTDDSERIWFSPKYYLDEDERYLVNLGAERADRPVYVILDRHIHEQTPRFDQGFLHQGPFQPHGEWCSNMGIAQPRTVAFVAEVSA